MKPVAWQWVIHGSPDGLREEVVNVLLEEKGPKAAFRYACCGLGDTVKLVEGAASVGPRGCGHKLCPRCSRKSGQRIARRIFEHLARAPHGDIHSVCLTQRVNTGEALTAARARMEQKARRFLRQMKDHGMTACMISTHIVWSKSGNGWHYHLHLVTEFPAGTRDAGYFTGLWASTAAPEWVQTDAEMVRLVVPAGGAMVDLEGDKGDTHFWKESSHDAARAIQYPVRDMVQGVAVFRLGGDRDKVRECVAALLRESSGWKLRRALGRWRKRPPPLPEDAVRPPEPAAGKPVSAAPGKKGEVVGQLCRLYRLARHGGSFERSIFKRLELSVGNSSDFAKRFVRFCRRAQEGITSG